MSTHRPSIPPFSSTSRDDQDENSRDPADVILDILDSVVEQANSSLAKMAAFNQELEERLQDADSSRSQEMAQQHEREKRRREHAKERALAREEEINFLISDNQWYEQQLERLNKALNAAMENSKELAAEFATLNGQLASVTHQRNYYD